MKMLLSVIMVVALFLLVMYLFRSSMPMLWMLGAVVAFGILVFFPYKTYFKIKDKNENKN